MEIIDVTSHQKSLKKFASDLATAQQQKKHYKIQCFLSLGATAMLGAIGAISLSTNTTIPSDAMIAIEATAYFSLVAAAYNKVRQFDSGARKIAIENLVALFDHKDRNTIEHLKDKIIKEDNEINSLGSQITKLRDKIFNPTSTDIPTLK